VSKSGEKKEKRQPIQSRKTGFVWKKGISGVGKGIDENTAKKKGYRRRRIQKKGGKRAKIRFENPREREKKTEGKERTERPR